MKLGKKLLAVLCTVSLLLAMVVIPASAFTGSTATMPTDVAVIENFDGENTLGWQAVKNATLEFSDAYGYGTSGKSAHVSWSASGWSGFKTASGKSISLTKTGLAFWAYNAGSELTNFAVVLLQDGSKYEAKITLKTGESIYQIPWTDFILQNGTTLVDTTKTVAQIEFTKSSTTADYYIDQICAYTGDATQSQFIPSTVKMPDNYTVIDNFNAVSSLAWASNKSTAELSTDRGYGATGKSMHVSWSASGWCGFKTGSNSSITPTGDGIAFWAYNAASALSSFYVKVTSGGVTYEKAITLAAGEAVYTIPWSDFAKGDATYDGTSTITQIEFTKSAASADYYIDELSFYSNYIASTLKMPDNFTVIDNFNGQNTLGWKGTGKAETTFKISAERGYGADGKGVHVSWNESGWSGFKTGVTNANVALTGDGLAFWAYNAGSEIKDLAIVLVQNNGTSDVKYEKKITLTQGEAVYKIPWTDFIKNSVAIDTTKTVKQIEFTKSVASADYFVDQIGCYTDPKKPATSEIVFDTSAKTSSSAVGGTGKGATGGQDSVYWKLYDVLNDPRMTRACHFTASDITAGYFVMSNVSKSGNIESADISDAEYFGNLRFWIKSDVANRKLKASLISDGNVSGTEVEFTITEAGKWQEVVIPVQQLFDASVIIKDADWLETIKCVKFSGQGFAEEYTYKEGEVFKIGGVRIYTSDPVDYSEYADLDTEPTQPADDGSYNPDSEVIGSIDFTMDTYSGNPGYGKVKKVTFDDFATEQNGIKITFGDGIQEVGYATKGLSMWFGENGEANTIDLSTLEDGYFSMWVRGSRAGMSFIWFLKDDTDNDAKTTVVTSYTIKEANTWEEVRVPLSEIMLPGMLDTEYVFKMEIRNGYGQFNWRYPYTSEKWLQTGDVLEVAAVNVTEGKPIDPFAEPETDDGDNSENTDNNNTANNTQTGTGTGTTVIGGNTATDTTGTSTDTAGGTSATAPTSPVTGESAVTLWMLMAFASINGLLAALSKRKTKS